MSGLLRRGPTREAVARMTLWGRLKPGERINESRLSKELGVSRTPLREALLQLEGEGLVRAAPRRGFVVCELTAEEARELYPVLWTLEGLAIRESGGQLSTLVPALRLINARLAAAQSSPELALELDTRWHETLLSRSPNHHLAELIGVQRRLVERYERLYMSHVDLVPHSVAQHEAVIQAIETANGDEVVARLEDNWSFSLERLLVELRQRSER